MGALRNLSGRVIWYHNENDEVEEGVAGSAADEKGIFVDAMPFHSSQSLIPGVMDRLTG